MLWCWPPRSTTSFRAGEVDRIPPPTFNVYASPATVAKRWRRRVGRGESNLWRFQAETARKSHARVREIGDFPVAGRPVCYLSDART